MGRYTLVDQFKTLPTTVNYGTGTGTIYASRALYQRLTTYDFNVGDNAYANDYVVV